MYPRGEYIGKPANRPPLGCGSTGLVGVITWPVPEQFEFSEPRGEVAHLSNVYRKLGVTGRSGVARALAERRD